MKNKLTSTAKQTILIFEEFIRRQEVVEFIKEYRKVLNLPENGLPITEKNRKEFSDYLILFLYIPDEARELFPEETKQKPLRVVNTCMAFVKQQGIESVQMGNLLRMYLFFNKVIPEMAGMFPFHNDFLHMEHLSSELADYGREDYKLLQMVYDRFERISKTHPIALYINPDVSQREIQDFLSKNWNFIEMYREEKKAKTIKLRKKSLKKQERNDFIYKNRHLPRKKIMELLYETLDKDFEIDYGYIGKIISLEKRKRENK